MKQPCFIFDVEGTLTDYSHRIHLAQKGDWKAFQDGFVFDIPNERVIGIAKSFTHLGADIILSTGMPEKMRPDLAAFIDKIDLRVRKIFMRHNHHGTITSPELKKLHLDKIKRVNFEVLGAFDDRIDVCEMYYQNGIEVFHLPFREFKKGIK